MVDLAKRLAELRRTGKLDAVFDKRMSKPEYKRPGPAGFTMSCIPVLMDYSME